MNILFATSEIASIVETGGLAKVSRSLPITLHALGIDIALIMPHYRAVKIESEALTDIQIPIEDTLVQGSIRKGFVPQTEIPVYLVVQDHYYDRDDLYTTKGKDYIDNLERFTFFSRAVLEVVARGIRQVDIIHANDWQTALIPILLQTDLKDDPLFNKLKTLYTIHNLAYQGIFPAYLYPVIGVSWDHFNLEELEFYNQLNLMKGGILYADRINTVSPTYAQEIQTPEFGAGLEGVLQKRSDDLTGIINCIDYQEWSTEEDKWIAYRYDQDTVVEGKRKNKESLLNEVGLPLPKSRQPLFAMISRLTHQKGTDLVISILPSLIAQGAQVVVLGTGDPDMEQALRNLQFQYPEACAVMIDYDVRLSHQIEAGADMFLMPSRFEPCGLNQMYSLRYGTIPIVHAVGGLRDTVIETDARDNGNGFMFDDETEDAFLKTCRRAMDYFQNESRWLNLMRRAMSVDFSWNQSAQKYVQLYQSLL